MHDFSWNKQGAGNIVKQICKDRDDLIYIGDFGATVHINGVRVYLTHPDGGTAYALSYRPQKMAESLASENKPHILILGH